MDNAEAIEILKSRRMCAAYVDSEYVDNVDIEAIDLAISALEKQEQKKPMTNADRIRAMTDEELVLWISQHDWKSYYYGFWTGDQILDWLKQEVKDNA